MDRQKYESDCYQALRRQAVRKGRERLLDQIQAALDAGRSTDDVLTGCGLRAQLEAGGLPPATVQRLLEETAAALDYMRRERPRARNYDGPLCVPWGDP